MEQSEKNIEQSDKILIKIYVRLYFKILRSFKGYLKKRTRDLIDSNNKELYDDILKNSLYERLEEDIFNKRSLSFAFIEMFVELLCAENNNSEICNQFLHTYIKPALINPNTYNIYKNEMITKLKEFPNSLGVKDDIKLSNITNIIKQLQEITNSNFTENDYKKLKENIDKMFKDINTTQPT